MRLKGASVLITGASSGIGEASAIAFARRGARLAICARRVDRLQKVAEACQRAGAQAVTLRRADVRKPVEARGIVAAALRDFERLDVLVNNAGVGWVGPFEEMPEDTVKNLIETNLLGPIWTSQAALPSMLAARRGIIINVASVAAFRANPYSALYSATKQALAGLSHALRGELTGTGVKVCAVYPATTDTEWFKDRAGKRGPAYPAWWVANAIVRTARFPRRDVIVLPFRLVQLAEAVLGGPLDHLLGEARRRALPALSSGLPPS